MIYINRVYYYVDGIHHTNKWEVVKNLEIYFSPLIININQDFHDFMKAFFLKSQSDDPTGHKSTANTIEQMKAKVKGCDSDAPKS
jgi:hypothetical protein